MIDAPGPPHTAGARRRAPMAVSRTWIRVCRTDAIVQHVLNGVDGVGCRSDGLWPVPCVPSDVSNRVARVLAVTVRRVRGLPLGLALSVWLEL